MQDSTSSAIGAITDLDNLLAVILTLSIFAWLGWKRGARSEWITFGVALMSYVLLFAGQERIVNITLRVPKVISALTESGTGTEATGATATTAVTTTATSAALLSDALSGNKDVQDVFIFILWFGLLILTYLLTSLRPLNRRPVRNFWASLGGLLNGFLFIYVFVPMLGQFYSAAMQSMENAQQGVLAGYIALLKYAVEVFIATIQWIWELLLHPHPLLLLILVTILLTVAAMSLRRSVRARS